MVTNTSPFFIRVYSLKYWSDNKKRLDRLVQSLHQYNPGLKVPVLFTYFPDSSLTESTIEKVTIQKRKKKKKKILIFLI